MNSNLQAYLDKAMTVVQKLGIVPHKGEESQMSQLLQDVVKVDEAKVLAIAKTLEHQGTFNQMVREKIEDVRVGDRYSDITKMFDSIREDSKTMLKQLEDGKIDLGEKLQNFWMRLVRGSTHARFEKIRTLYVDVSKDTKKHLDTENDIMNAYMDFRGALKESEGLAFEVMKTQEGELAKSKMAFDTAIQAVKGYTGADNAERSRLELKRDEAQRAFEQEDKKYQLIKDVAENLSMGYNVGETLVAKLKQTHDVKDQVYRRAVTFFTTNEHVFTTLDAVYTSQRGLHESTQTLESMKTGVNKGLEDVAELGGKLEEAALKAGYGSTYNVESVKKLVDAVVSFQETSRQTIEQLRKESAKNTQEIARIVDDGKDRYRAAIEKYATQ